MGGPMTFSRWRSPTGRAGRTRFNFSRTATPSPVWVSASGWVRGSGMNRRSTACRYGASSPPNTIRGALPPRKRRWRSPMRKPASSKFANGALSSPDSFRGDQSFMNSSTAMASCVWLSRIGRGSNFRGLPESDKLAQRRARSRYDAGGGPGRQGFRGRISDERDCHCADQKGRGATGRAR